MTTRRGRELSELRRSSAAGVHGKTSPDRANTERNAIDQEIDDAAMTARLRALPGLVAMRVEDQERRAAENQAFIRRLIGQRPQFAAGCAAMERQLEQQLAPRCARCGTLVTAPTGDDPAGREWCTDECETADAEAAYEQCYQPGVAT